MHLIAQPLSSAAFAPFGEVVENESAEPRRYLQDATGSSPEAPTPRIWVSRYDAPRALPVVHPRLERHPYSAQTFVPLSVGRYVVLGVPSLADGSPDVANARAFVIGPGRGICYRRGTWHAPMTVLDGPARFAVMMWSTGAVETDDAWHELAAPITISGTPG